MIVSVRTRCGVSVFRAENLARAFCVLLTDSVFIFCGNLSKESRKTLAIYRKTCIITCMPAFWLWGKMSAAMERNEKGEIE